MKKNLELNYNQKISILKILIDTLQADGRTDAREIFFFNTIKDDFQLSEDDYETIKNYNSLIALANLKEFTEEEKVFVASLMNEMILADEEVNPFEIIVYDLVCECCNIKRNFIEEEDKGRNNYN